MTRTLWCKNTPMRKPLRRPGIEPGSLVRQDKRVWYHYTTGAVWAHKNSVYDIVKMSCKWTEEDNPVGTQLLLQKVIMESLNWSNPIKRLFMETSVSSNDPIKENMYSTCLTTACIRVFQCHQRHTVAVETRSWFTRVTNIPMSDNPQGVGIRYDHISLTTKSSDSQSYQAMTGAPHWRAPWGYALGV